MSRNQPPYSVSWCFRDGHNSDQGYHALEDAKGKVEALWRMRDIVLVRMEHKGLELAMRARV
jgi:hypothetical protein